MMLRVLIPIERQVGERLTLAEPSKPNVSAPADALPYPAKLFASPSESTKAVPQKRGRLDPAPKAKAVPEPSEKVQGESRQTVIWYEDSTSI
jgi:hypothetical protein